MPAIFRIPPGNGFPISEYRNTVLRLILKRDTYKWAAMRDDRSPSEFPQSIPASRLIARRSPPENTVGADRELSRVERGFRRGVPFRTVVRSTQTHRCCGPSGTCTTPAQWSHCPAPEVVSKMGFPAPQRNRKTMKDP